MNALKIVVDLDGTLCTDVDGNYERALPNSQHIEIVNRLFYEGHYIHIFTARGMASFRGNAFLAKLRWRRFTLRQLRSWGVRYHRVSLGKPSGDYYVDDKAFHSTKFFNDLASKSVDQLRPN